VTILDAILLIMVSFLGLFSIYLVDGWRRAMEAQLRAIQSKLEELEVEILYIRRGMP
jgi:hypothetical protein